MHSVDAYITKKYKFTVITYEKYNTKDILTEFNKKNHSSILIDDVHTVQYEMNVSIAKVTTKNQFNHQFSSLLDT